MGPFPIVNSPQNVQLNHYRPVRSPDMFHSSSIGPNSSFAQMSGTQYPENPHPSVSQGMPIQMRSNAVPAGSILLPYPVQDMNRDVLSNRAYAGSSHTPPFIIPARADHTSRNDSMHSHLPYPLDTYAAANWSHHPGMTSMPYSAMPSPTMPHTSVINSVNRTFSYPPYTGSYPVLANPTLQTLQNNPSRYMNRPSTNHLGSRGIGEGIAMFRPGLEPGGVGGGLLLSPAASVISIRGNVHLLYRDQSGCRQLQRMLELGERSLYQTIYEECLPLLGELITDSFGNYLFQKIFEIANPAERSEILCLLKPHLFSASLDLHGTRSVQTVIECCANSQIHVDLIIEGLNRNTIELCVDRNGNHVIQKCLRCFDLANNAFIFDAVAAGCHAVCTYRHGCCIIQRCLEVCRAKQRSVQQGYGSNILEEVIKYSVALVQV